MDIDLINTFVDLKSIKPGEIEEVFEDPFAVKFIPDSLFKNGEYRYFTVGQTIAQKILFICFNSDGKKATILAARDASEEESLFYYRNYKSYQ